MRYRGGGGKGAAPRSPSQRRAGRGTRGRGSGVTFSFPIRGSRRYKPTRDRGVPGTNPPEEIPAVQTPPGVLARCGSSSRSARGAAAPGEIEMFEWAFLKNLLLADFLGENKIWLRAGVSPEIPFNNSVI